MIISLAEKILSTSEGLIIGIVLIIGTTLIVREFFSREITKVLIDDFICERYPEETISTLPVQAVSEMVNLYESRQLTKIEHGLKIEDARAVWFDLKTLKTFLYHIENETRKNRTDISDEQLGVHIYYGSYSDDKEYNYTNYGIPLEESDEYKGKHTVVMIPTIERDGVHHDYDPRNAPSYTNTLAITLSRSDNQNVIALGARNVDSRAFARNHGGLFPPGNFTGLNFIND